MLVSESHLCLDFNRIVQYMSSHINSFSFLPPKGLNTWRWLVIVYLYRRAMDVQCHFILENRIRNAIVCLWWSQSAIMWLLSALIAKWRLGSLSFNCLIIAVLKFQEYLHPIDKVECRPSLLGHFRLLSLPTGMILEGNWRTRRKHTDQSRFPGAVTILATPLCYPSLSLFIRYNMFNQTMRQIYSMHGNKMQKKCLQSHK